MKDSQKNPKKIKSNNPFKVAGDNLLVVFSTLLAILIVIVIASAYTTLWIWQNNALPSPARDISLSDYPELLSKLDPGITAAAAVAIDDDSKTVLFAKNENLRFTMASTVKIMTAIVALDYFKPDDVLTVYSETPPVVVGFPLGEKVYFIDVLYAMLLPSGNDAALMIAQNYLPAGKAGPGGEDAFIKKMNEKAKSMNLINTHFEDSSGLEDNNYSTPLEMARLASFALKNKTFSQIVATKKKTITNISGTNTYKLSNLDQLLAKDGITGVKTGYTQEAGGVLITSMEENGRSFILVVMKSLYRFTDIEKILSKIEGNVIFVPASPSQVGSTHP